MPVWKNWAKERESSEEQQALEKLERVSEIAAAAIV